MFVDYACRHPVAPVEVLCSGNKAATRTQPPPPSALSLIIHGLSRDRNNHFEPTSLYDRRHPRLIPLQMTCATRANVVSCNPQIWSHYQTSAMDLEGRRMRSHERSSRLKMVTTHCIHSSAAWAPRTQHVSTYLLSKS